MNIGLDCQLSGSKAWFASLAGTLVVCGFLLGTSASAAEQTGDYTKEQAHAGQQVYSVSCSLCHGSQLQGGAAPALKGSVFLQSIQRNFPTAQPLFDLISTRMPVNNPGGLSQEQYRDVLAFVLSENSYPEGTSSLDAAHLKTVALLPLPDQTSKSADSTLEIQNIGASDRRVVGTLPDKSSVDISDAMMSAVDSHATDWLLHGRDYSNQRFSPLKNINAANVASLVPVALIQTGIIGSFETTPIVVNGVMYATTPVADNKMKILAVRGDSGDLFVGQLQDLLRAGQSGRRRRVRECLCRDIG
jgi:alcohol dehydrogenase (cytochrome c)